MSHFYTVVLVEKDCQDIEKRVAELLAPYDENILDYNPRSKWDWWVIGGRYDGVITGNYQSSYNGFNFGAQHQTLQNNIVDIEELIDNYDRYPFAIVTPKGEWFERGEMGWFGCVSNEKENDLWESQCKAILNTYKDCLAVGCDLHI